MDGVACEFEVAGIVFSRVSIVRKGRVRGAARDQAVRRFACESSVSHAPAPEQLARQVWQADRD
jgi:hypothetical protein